jgi:hypothetical protein
LSYRRDTRKAASLGDRAGRFHGGDSAPRPLCPTFGRESIQVQKRTIPKIIDGIAAALAATFSEEELAQVVTFAESKAGQAWFSRGSEAQAAENAATRSLWEDIRKDAAARFCRQTACPGPPAPASAK